jgi:hypothetical protein
MVISHLVVTRPTASLASHGVSTCWGGWVPGRYRTTDLAVARVRDRAAGGECMEVVARPYAVAVYAPGNGDRVFA